MSRKTLTHRRPKKPTKVKPHKDRFADEKGKKKKKPATQKTPQQITRPPQSTRKTRFDQLVSYYVKVFQTKYGLNPREAVKQYGNEIIVATRRMVNAEKDARLKVIKWIIEVRMSQNPRANREQIRLQVVDEIVKQGKYAKEVKAELKIIIERRKLLKY